MDDEARLRSAVCHAAHQMWMRRLIAGTGGAVSAEWGRRRFLVTPCGVRRADLEPAQLLCVDMGGHPIMGDGRLDEAAWRLHRAAYQSDRPGGVRATALAAPASVTSMLRLHPDAAALELTGCEPLPIVAAEDQAGLEQAIGAAPAVAVRGVGLLAAAGSCAAALDLIEDLEHAATVDLCTLARN